MNEKTVKEASAKFSFVRMSPRKIKTVVDLIRGKHINNAMSILNFCKRRAAKEVVEKLLKSAIDNAVKDKKLNESALYVKKVYVDNGPILKRFRARAMGRAAMIKKRTAHVNIVLGEK